MGKGKRVVNSVRARLKKDIEGSLTRRHVYIYTCMIYIYMCIYYILFWIKYILLYKFFTYIYYIEKEKYYIYRVSARTRC